MAIVGAFVKYVISLVFCVAVAAAGIFCGSKWNESSKAKKAQNKEA